MEKSYKQLKLEDRNRITEMMAEGRNITEIAEALGRVVCCDNTFSPSCGC